MNKAKSIEKLRVFRKNMGGELTNLDIDRIFNGNHSNYTLSLSLQRVVHLVETKLKYLCIFNWVKYIAITGSYSAGTNKVGDDIDLFIVVKNGVLWWYRGLMLIHPMLYRSMRREDVKNRVDGFCINLICEERGLEFSEDIFNFHELMFMKSIYNPEYKETIYRANRWIRDYGYYWSRKLDNVKISTKKVNSLLAIFDSFAFLAQILFMFIANHKPNLPRILKSYKEGRIEFFPQDFKTRVLTDSTSRG